MKNWLLLLLVPFSVNAANFTVEIETKRGKKTFNVSAPTDQMALDSVIIGVVYNKKLKRPGAAVVKETGLTSSEFRPRVFRILTDHKDYSIELHVANPAYAFTAIQASRYLMSRSATKDVILIYKDDHLKSRQATRYVLQLKNQEISYLLNSNNIEEGRVALEIAAQMSHLSRIYRGIKIPSYTCVRMFAN